MKSGDVKIHNLIDTINPDLRTIDRTDGKKRVREFYAMTAEDAYAILQAIAQLHGREKKLKLVKPREEEEQEADDAEESNAAPDDIYFNFWSVFDKEAKKYPGFRDEISLRKISTRPYTDLASGTSGIRVTLFIRTREKNIGGGIYFAGNKELYQAFYKHRAKINRQIREALPQGSIRWTERAKDCTIRHFLDADVKSTPKKDWPKFARQLCQEALLMKLIIKQYLP